MKKYLLSLIALFSCVALLSSCEDNDLEKRQVTFTATKPADDLSSSRPGSIINGVPAADGFNLNAQWKAGDKIQIFVRQDEKVYQAESPSTVSDISGEGKAVHYIFLCRTEFDVPFMENTMHSFGINCIWYDNHDDLPGLLDSLMDGI